MTNTIQRVAAIPIAAAVITGPLGSGSSASADPARASRTSSAVAESGGSSRLKVVRGESSVSGPGPRRRFIVEVDRRLEISGRHFAKRVKRILYNDKSWGGNGRLGMKRVDSGDVHFRVTLAAPRTVDRLCAPLPTNGIYSCFNGYRAVINNMRWRRGAETYGWKRHLKSYRHYLINHEVGHALGHSHRSCPGSGRLAPVMMQQTISLGACRRNGWPLGYERGPAP